MLFIIFLFIILKLPGNILYFIKLNLYVCISFIYLLVINGAYLYFMDFLKYNYIFNAESSLLISFILCFLILFTQIDVNFIIFDISISLINSFTYFIFLNFWILISPIFDFIMFNMVYLRVKKKLYLY